MKDLILNGATTTRLNSSLLKIRQALKKELDSESLSNVEKHLRSVFRDQTSLKSQFKKQKKRQSDTDPKPEVPVFTKDQLTKEAQKLLNQKIQESLNLIKLDREQSMNRTIQRFQGWASSIPLRGQPQTHVVTVRTQTGTTTVPKSHAELERESKRTGTPISLLKKTKQKPTFENKKVRRKLPPRSITQYDRKEFAKAAEKMDEPIQSIRYKERRVAIDQGHKLAAAISEVQAYSNHAIALTWRHHFSKNPREDHQEMDGETFVYPESWAVREGLVRKQNLVSNLPVMPAQAINCRCTADHVYTLRELYRRAPHLLTKKGLKLLGVE